MLVNYPQSATPEGGFVIERPSHGQLERAMTGYKAAETIQSAIRHGVAVVGFRKLPLQTT